MIGKLNIFIQAKKKKKLDILKTVVIRYFVFIINKNNSHFNFTNKKSKTNLL